MKIAMINGSPKRGKSNSSILLKTLASLIDQEHTLFSYGLSEQPLTDAQYLELYQMDVLVFAFPLYVDAIPAPLLKMLVELEIYMKTKREREIYVYALINNGFYEGKQNWIALEILKNWCLRAGLIFGQGIGQGAGEMLGYLEQVPLGKGPLKELGKAMYELADHIQHQESGETLLLQPAFPRFAWKLAGTYFFWNPTAKKNGLKRRDILQRR